MTDGMLQAGFDRAEVKRKKDGSIELPEGRTLTLHAAHQGVHLSVGKVSWLRVKEGVIEACDVQGEQFVLSQDDVFAAAISGGKTGKPGRKAGFLS